MINKFLFSVVLVLNLIQLEVFVSSASTQKNVKLSKHPVILVVSYDGFRYDYMSKTETPHLKSILAEGVSVPYMKAQFPTKTFPNHHSISTGLYPESHGVIANEFFDPVVNKRLSGFKSEDESQFWNFRNDVLPIWIRNEQAGDDRISGCYMWSGSPVRYGNDSSLLPHYVIPKYDGSVPWENRVDTVISWLTNDQKPANLVFLYYNEPDTQGHKYGTDDDITLTEIRKSDDRTGYLVAELKKAGIYDDINLIILSDHGMQTVTKENIINITAVIDPLLYNRFGSSPVYHIQSKEATNFETIYSTFKNKSASSGFKVYKKSEMGFWNYANNRRIMDLILVADEGYAFDDTKVNNKGVCGVHGYDNNSPNMRAFFLARGPLFKSGYASPTPINNLDLFPFFCKILNIPLVPNNGTLNIMSQFLVDTSKNPKSNAKNKKNTAFIMTVNFWVLISLLFVSSFVTTS